MERTGAAEGGRGAGRAKWVHAALWAVVILAVSSIPMEEIPPPLQKLFTFDKLMHAIVYGLLGLLAARAVFDRPRNIAAAWIVWLFCVVYGGLDEWHQALIPGRFPSPYDALANGVGAGIGVLLWLVAGRGRSPGRVPVKGE